ncbi:MAG: hypothetical protein H3C43_03845 [Leptonema sp. (in: Bacteria)]|nr:hypothetical protein [Leptonema sp. (in: bacteria)]
MNKQILSYLLPVSITVFVLFLFLSCSKKIEPTQESRTKYGDTAAKFCKLVTECQRQELQKTFADDIQRRTYLESKMTDQACVDTQLIAIDKNVSLFAAFQECNRVLNLIEPTDCSKQIETLHQSQSCKTALQL